MSDITFLEGCKSLAYSIFEYGFMGLIPGFYMILILYHI